MTIANLFLCMLCLAAASPVWAEELAPSPSPATEVQVDEKAGMIRFVVAGKTIATIDRSGVTVEGDVRYTGATHDIGTPPDNSDKAIDRDD